MPFICNNKRKQLHFHKVLLKTGSNILSMRLKVYMEHYVQNFSINLLMVNTITMITDSTFNRKKNTKTIYRYYHRIELPFSKKTEIEYLNCLWKN